MSRQEKIIIAYHPTPSDKFKKDIISNEAILVMQVQNLSRCSVHPNTVHQTFERHGNEVSRHLHSSQFTSEHPYHLQRTFETQRWRISKSASFVELAIRYERSWLWVYCVTYTSISHCAKNFRETRRASPTKSQSLPKYIRTLFIPFVKDFRETRRWRTFVISRSASFAGQTVRYERLNLSRHPYTNISRCSGNSERSPYHLQRTLERRGDEEHL